MTKKNKRCSSCGEAGHCRRTSEKCKLNGTNPSDTALLEAMQAEAQANQPPAPAAQGAAFNLFLEIFGPVLQDVMDKANAKREERNDDRKMKYIDKQLRHLKVQQLRLQQMQIEQQQAVQQQVEQARLLEQQPPQEEDLTQEPSTQIMESQPAEEYFEYDDPLQAQENQHLRRDPLVKFSQEQKRQLDQLDEQLQQIQQRLQAREQLQQQQQEQPQEPELIDAQDEQALQKQLQQLLQQPYPTSQIHETQQHLLMMPQFNQQQQILYQQHLAQTQQIQHLQLQQQLKTLLEEQYQLQIKEKGLQKQLSTEPEKVKEQVQKVQQRQQEVHQSIQTLQQKIDTDMPLQSLPDPQQIINELELTSKKKGRHSKTNTPSKNQVLQFSYWLPQDFYNFFAINYKMDRLPQLAQTDYFKDPSKYNKGSDWVRQRMSCHQFQEMKNCLPNGIKEVLTRIEEEGQKRWSTGLVPTLNKQDMKFGDELINQLSPSQIVALPMDVVHHLHYLGNRNSSRKCTSCSVLLRKPNATRTRYICKECQVSFCKDCFQSHHSAFIQFKNTNVNYFIKKRKTK